MRIEPRDTPVRPTQLDVSRGHLQFLPVIKLHVIPPAKLPHLIRIQCP
ncbi:hypothetical protein G173_gp217 [Erwinia phage phiEaH2]|uniref:Uncharacterized protein n=1 Tax=Erwinia phage phiEaH2 TaxID=1029988 RepID=J7KJP9_9CAUD|nr:hypothetical protein G173_gp217 [Erwinia phage phiEaH2]AFQ96762.1 hypothetical protein [Erwinia phage phiEaH2]